MPAGPALQSPQPQSAPNDVPAATRPPMAAAETLSAGLLGESCSSPQPPWYPLPPILPHYVPTPPKSDRLLALPFKPCRAGIFTPLDGSPIGDPGQSIEPQRVLPLVVPPSSGQEDLNDITDVDKLIDTADRLNQEGQFEAASVVPWMALAQSLR